MQEFRGTGKTTRLIEDAIALTGEGHDVHVVGAHTRWLRDLERDFRAAGLVGVYFWSVPQILNGSLRGRTGRVLIDDVWDIPWHEREQIYMEQDRLESRGR